MSSTKITNPWLLTRTINPRARLNLFCFPYAGGGAQLFNNWQKNFGPDSDIQVYAVQYPGRGSRVRETAFTECSALVQAFLPHLLPVLNKPFAFFGHSMGAIIAFDVARILQEQHRLKPERLFVSGRRAPHLVVEEAATYLLPDEEFTEELRRLNGTPAEVLAHPELMQLMLGIIRADFTLTQTYTYSPGPPLSCPISVFGGSEDHDVTREQLDAWCELTTGECSVQMFEGDHFFIQSDEAIVVEAVKEQLVH